MKCRVCGQRISTTICSLHDAHHVTKSGSHDTITDQDHRAVEDVDNLDRQERSNETKGTAK